MKRTLLMPALIALILSLCGCLASSAKLGDNPEVKKVAVISLAVSDWGGSIKMGAVGGEKVDKLIRDSLNDMLTYTEQQLATRWEVKKTASFVKSSGYRQQGVERQLLSVLVPSPGGQPMTIFTNVSKEIKTGIIDPAKAKALCTALQVDAVVLVFSEWTTKTGGVVPTTKAVSKNILSVWDKNGQKLVTKRVDMMGTRTLGAMNVKAVNQETISEWSDTYKKSVARILQEI